MTVRGFVTGLTHSPENQALVLTVLSLGQSFGFEVVAEGIETAEDLHKLQELGCPAMQGYFLGRPMPQHETIEWIGLTHPAADPARETDLIGPPPSAGADAAAKRTLQ